MLNLMVSTWNRNLLFLCLPQALPRAGACGDAD